MPVGDPTFDALRAWRLERAREDAVPAYVVFPDRTLVEIASRRPRTLGELARSPASAREARALRRRRARRARRLTGGFVRRSRRVAAALVLAAYAAVSCAYFGVRLLSHPGSEPVGFGVDPQIFAWSFAWWPHALLHGHDPFAADVLWAPEGVDLAWAATAPGLALAFAPLTLAFGPIPAYNVTAVALPPSPRGAPTCSAGT